MNTDPLRPVETDLEPAQTLRSTLRRDLLLVLVALVVIAGTVYLTGTGR